MLGYDRFLAALLGSAIDQVPTLDIQTKLKYPFSWRSRMLKLKLWVSGYHLLLSSINSSAQLWTHPLRLTVMQLLFQLDHTVARYKQGTPVDVWPR